MDKKIRLDKYLADSLIGTRADVKKYIYHHKVTINGRMAKDPGEKIDPETDVITYRGEKVVCEPFRYFMLNKPAGVVSAVSDKQDTTVIDLLSDVNTKDLFPVGRLDKDTEGLLLITNDGKLSHDLLSPKKHVEKTYIALTDKKLDDTALDDIRSGVDIGEKKPCLPAKIEYLGEVTDNIHETSDTALVLHKYEIKISEGKYHQIKRMFSVKGAEVIYLKRTAFGALVLDETLKPGDYIKLDKESVKSLF
ncbi:MAG: rRNA pseudouridine synthase [Lachnospiraceae bacterium]|nr:rRNA pseudouridine synthase [Lachnospiraceae bacterium]